MLDNGKTCKMIINNIFLTHHHFCCHHVMDCIFSIKLNFQKLFSEEFAMVSCYVPILETFEILTLNKPAQFLAALADKSALSDCHFRICHKG